MAESKAIDLKEVTLLFRDGKTTPSELEFKFDEGNITWTVHRNITVKKDRGILDYMKEEDQEAMKVNLEGRFHEITSSSGDPVSPFEFLTFSGAAAGYTSTSPLCSASAIDIIVKVNHACGTTIQDEIMTFADFTYEDIGGDFKAGSISISGVCLAVFPTSVRTVLA